jgi:hypothetical protein
MALPLYVVERDITGTSLFENVVILHRVGDTETVLYWDILDDISKAAYDTVSGELDIISAMRAATFRNQSLYEYLRYAIVEHIHRTTFIPIRAFPIDEVVARAFDPSLNSVRSGRYSTGGSLSMFESTNVFTYGSSYGPSRFRDHIVTVGSGTVSGFEGKVRLSTGTTVGSSVVDDTVENGRYHPGAASDGSCALFIPTPLTGDQYIDVGVGNNYDGAFFRITATDTFIRIMRKGVLVESVASTDWNINKCNGDEPRNGGVGFNLVPWDEGFIYGITYTWYGVGKIRFHISKPIVYQPETLTQIPVHEYIPEGLTFIDPNLPVRALVDNGTTAGDVIVDIGGRKYDIHGQFNPETRLTTMLIPLVSLAARRTILSIRKKSNFPDTGRPNTVPVYVESIEATVNDIGFLRIYTAARGTIGAGWINPPEVTTSSETAVEVNLTQQDLQIESSRELLYGPTILLGGTPNVVEIANTKGTRTPIIETEELVVEYDPTGNTTGFIIITISEEW